MPDNLTKLLVGAPSWTETDAYDADAIKRAILDKLFFVRATYPRLATNTDYFMALAYCVRDMLLHRWVST
ncbi:MAG: hypothetical protein PVF63_01015, partial [Gammaproteobacteria bacterium]